MILIIWRDRATKRLMGFSWLPTRYKNLKKIVALRSLTALAGLAIDNL
ncbi:MAG: hypothetical protein RBJ76_04495 [Stenomitos frigidus ULC029]